MPRDVRRRIFLLLLNSEEKGTVFALPDGSAASLNFIVEIKPVLIDFSARIAGLFI